MDWSMDCLSLPAMYALTLLPLACPLGDYMYRVFEGERTFLSPLLGPLESLLYRACGVSPGSGMPWTSYAVALLLFHATGFVVLFLLLVTQSWHPLALNPGGAPGMGPALAFNTAVSFVTNTDWQAYGGEREASYASQMFGFTWQNFVSAASAMAVAAALMRGLTRRTRNIGNYWADLTRAVLYILLPLAAALAFVLCSQGVVQNLKPYPAAQTLEGEKQTLAMGPAASQTAIKALGSNGGGFFGANSAHPYENPTPLTNYLQMLAILLIPAGMTVTFGLYAKSASQGRALLCAMMILFLAGASTLCALERNGNPILASLGAEQRDIGNLEGKETRFGAADSALYAAVTTAGACGAVNASHDSFTPLGGLALMLNMALNGVVFGGAGAGMLSILLYAVLTVFIAGLMVGRTPEYLGKKIEAWEMKMAMLAILSAAGFTLAATAISVSAKAGLAGPGNFGPHGLSEILYAATSVTAGNGSAFGGLAAQSAFYNLLLGVCMLAGRFLSLIPMLAIAGSMAGKRPAPQSDGSFPTTGPLFILLLIGVILITGALTYIPAFTLGPIAEHFAMLAGEVF